MLAVVGIIVVLLLWRFLLLTAAEVFEAAGLPRAAAAFQARSALTGVGYTTGESAVVVNDPASREAASLLFVVGFVGPVTILGLLGFGFFHPSSSDFEIRAAVLVALLVLGFVFERLGINARLLQRPARFAARVLFRAELGTMWTVLGDYAIAAVRISPSNPLADHPLGTGPFGDPGVTVLGIRRVEDKGLRYIAYPSLDEGVLSGDELVLRVAIVPCTVLGSHTGRYSNIDVLAMAGLLFSSFREPRGACDVSAAKVSVTGDATTAMRLTVRGRRRRDRHPTTDRVWCSIPGWSV